MYTSGIHVAARFITLHQSWALMGVKPSWWIVLWKKWLRLKYLCCCRSFSVAQINLYLHVSLNLFSYLYNSKLPKVTQSQRATAQHKHYLTEPEVTPRFCEASGYHSLGFLPAECKKEYGIKKGHPDSLISKAQATELQGDLRGPGCILSMNETLAQDYKSRDWFDIAHYSSMPE